MIGNVAEWCFDGYQSEFSRVVLETSCVDPAFPLARSGQRIVRGGEFS